jgi:hypothetical protein
MAADPITAGGEAHGQLNRKECRVYERYPSGVPTSCQPASARAGGDLKWSANVYDVSLGGIGLVVSRRFERGTALAVEVPELHSDQCYTTFAKVMHVRRLDDGSWLHGCAFVGELSEDGLKALQRPAAGGEPAPEPLPADRPQETPAAPADARARSVVRRVQLYARLSDGRIVSRFVKQLSLSGPWPLPKGTVLTGWVAKGPATRAAVRMKVRSCSPEGDAWRLVCKLMDSPPERVVQLFDGPAPPRP